MPFPPNMRRGGRPKGVLTERTRFRMELALRLEAQNLGLTDSQIAQHIGMSMASYLRLRKLPLYHQLRSQFQTGILSKADENIYDKYDLNRMRLETAVPMALEGLVNLATQSTDKKLKLEAIKEVLDRHGRFAKVSRVGNVMPEQGRGVDPSKAEDIVATELAGALAKAKSKSDEEVIQ